MSEYDQKCYEDNITNRMLESLELFETTVNNTLFKDKYIVLFLNKFDLFHEKIQVSQLKVLFDDYSGGGDVTKGVDFIVQKYEDCNKGNTKRLFKNIVTATSKDDVKNVMEEVIRFLDYVKKDF